MQQATHYAANIGWREPQQEGGKPRPLAVPLPQGSDWQRYIETHYGASTVADIHAMPIGNALNPYGAGDCFKVCGANPALLPLAVYEIPYGYFPRTDEGRISATALAYAMQRHGLAVQVYDCRNVYLERDLLWLPRLDPSDVAALQG